MIEKQKQNIIDAYNAVWDEMGMLDNTGLIQVCKDEFKLQVDLLIKTIKDYYEQKTPPY